MLDQRSCRLFRCNLHTFPSPPNQAKNALERIIFCILSVGALFDFKEQENVVMNHPNDNVRLTHAEDLGAYVPRPDECSALPSDVSKAQAIGVICKALQVMVAQIHKLPVEH